jgi:hypothetical protein
MLAIIESVSLQKEFIHHGPRLLRTFKNGKLIKPLTGRKKISRKTSENFISVNFVAGGSGGN